MSEQRRLVRTNKAFFVPKLANRPLASEITPGLYDPPSLPDEPPAAQPKKSSKKSKKSKKSEVDTDPSDHGVTDHRANHKAAHLWAKSDSSDVDFSAEADRALKEEQLPSNNRLAVLNRLVLAAWDLLDNDEKQPWIDDAVEILSADPPLA
jgi:hypothetical protein